jgi:hypothetical protein
MRSPIRPATVEHNNPARKGELASDKVRFGEANRFTVAAVHCRESCTAPTPKGVYWMVWDEWDTGGDVFSRLGSLVRQAHTFEQAVSGLAPLTLSDMASRVYRFRIREEETWEDLFDRNGECGNTIAAGLAKKCRGLFAGTGWDPRSYNAALADRTSQRFAFISHLHVDMIDLGLNTDLTG